MDKTETYFHEAHRMTNFAEALARSINGAKEYIISDYEIFLLACDIYRNRSARYLRGEYPTMDQYRNAREILKKANVIAADKDYAGMWQVLSQASAPADEIVCSADPYCYISHLSAMQRYGLTFRRPEALHITHPGQKLLKKLKEERAEKDAPQLTFGGVVIDAPRALQPRHPAVVRGRKIHQKGTKHLGDWKAIRRSKARVSSIGQVFLEMLDDSQLCGGMEHVLEVWEEHAKTHLNDIVKRIDAAGSGVVKMRAGYILEERMAVQHPAFQEWAAKAQRGGSMVLDPSLPYKDVYSEKWMISINVS